MKKTIIGLAAMAVLAGGTQAFALSNVALEEQLQELIQQNKMLTERIKNLESQAGVPAAAGEEGGSSFLRTMLDSVELSGVVEVEAGMVDDEIADPDKDSSDIALATVEIGLDAQISKWSSAHILLLYEEGEEDDHIIVDEGTITLGNLDEFPAYLTAGKMYVPFGSFESNMISDPLTLEIGETGDSAVQIGFETNGFYGSVYGFNGDINEEGEDDEVDTFGANLGYAMENDNMALDVGVDWINNIGDTDGIGDYLDTPAADGGPPVALDGEIDDYVAGLALHAVFSTGPFTLIGEYVTALDEFEANEISVKGLGVDGAEPSAFNIESAFTTEINNKETTFALAYQSTDEAVDMGLVEDLYIGSVSVGILDNTSLAFEYAIGDDYSESDGGTGDDITSATMQLAVEF